MLYKYPLDSINPPPPPPFASSSACPPPDSSSAPPIKFGFSSQFRIRGETFLNKFELCSGSMMRTFNRPDSTSDLMMCKYQIIFSAQIMFMRLFKSGGEKLKAFHIYLVVWIMGECSSIEGFCLKPTQPLKKNLTLEF